jgi:hypothetical protein
MVIGDKCAIWVESAQKSRVGAVTAASIANIYDKTIRTLMIETLGVTANITNNGQVVARDTMELADWLADGDGKLAILLLDIKDDYRTSGDSYVGGYFWSGNFFENDPGDLYLQYSNEMDMIYLDVSPGAPGSNDSNMSLAHEMQHLMNLVNGTITGRGGYPMDTWIDEGLSSAAEYIYKKNANVVPLHTPYRYGWFVNDPEGTIAKGNNFFVWGNDTGIANSTMDEYATVYMFFQWLRIQSGGIGIYKTIGRAANTDYRALTVAAGGDTAMSGNGYGDWETLLKTWMAANYINAPSGKYGYKGEFDSETPAFSVKTFPTGETTHPLLPGEGVYSVIDNGTDTGQFTNSGNIKYAGLKKAGTGAAGTPALGDDALLTYNTSTNLKGASENGKITGVVAGTGNSSMAAAFSGDLASYGSLRIDARDMLARNGHGKNVFTPLSNGSFGAGSFTFSVEEEKK